MAISTAPRKRFDPSAAENAPVPLLPDNPPGAPYPLDSLPPLMRDAAAAIAEHVQAPLPLAGQSVLGAAAYLAQTRVNAPHMHKPDGMPCSLFILTLADSGDRKSECHRLAFLEITQAEREAREKHRQACDDIEQEAASLRGKKLTEFREANPLPPDPRTLYGDATFEPIVGDMIRGASAAMWDSDEGGQLFGGASLKADTRTSTIGGLCRAFDSGTFERTRARSNLEGSGVAFNRRFSVHLLAQQVAVAEALSDPLLRGQGFLPRFLFSSADSIAGTRFLTPDKLQAKSWSDQRLQRYWQRCKDVMAFPARITEGGEVRPPVVPLTAEATTVWLDFYNSIEVEQIAAGDYFTIRAFAGRAGELARRVAAVFACFQKSSEINEDVMGWACNIVRHSLSEWLRYSEIATPPQQMVMANALVEWITDAVRIDSWREFHRDKLGKAGPSNVRVAKKRDELLTILVEHKYLLTSDLKTYRLNPLLLAPVEPLTAPLPMVEAPSAIDDSEAF